MCLVEVKEPKVKSGIGYKEVLPLPGEVFAPQWGSFFTDGTGGCYQTTEMGADTMLGSAAMKVNVRYKVGRTYTVRHKRMATSQHSGDYPAGVHLYKHFPSCVDAGHVVLKCKYSKAVAEDNDVVVAMSVTPIEVIYPPKETVMPHIVPTHIKTKKQLREALLHRENIFFHDPALFDPRSVYSEDMKEGENVICTNHPRKTWVASVTRLRDGWKVK